MEMMSKLGLLRALLLSSLGLCAFRSSLGLAALRSPAPGAFRFSVRFLRIAPGEARRHLHRQTALQLLAIAWRGSSSGCDSPWQLGQRGTPLAPGGLGRPRHQTPKEDEAPPRHNGKERPTHTRKRRAPGAHLRALPGAQTRRAHAARNLRAPRHANRHVPAACNRHVPAACNQRRSAHRDVCKGAEERVITTLRLSVRLRARFAISPLASYLDRSVSDSGF